VADNVTLNAGTGGDTIAADDLAGVKHQLVKVEFGADGAATMVSAAAPLPVVQTGTHAVTGAGGTFPVTDSGGSLTVDAPVGTPVFVRLSDGSAAITTLPVSIASAVAVSGTFWQATQPVSLASVPAHDVTNAGTFAVQVSSSALPTGAATSAKQDTGNTSLASIDGKTPSLGQALAAASVPVVLTASQLSTLTPPAAITGFATETTLAAQSAKLPATLGQKAMAASLAVVVASDQSAIPVSGTFWQATQPVSIAAAVAVTDNGGSLTVDGSLATVSTVTSLTQFNGNAIDTNSGVKSAGTLRVVLATDQPALTNKLLVTPDANSAVNVAQVNGVAVTTGNGVSGTGVQRVTLASDSTGQVALAAGSASIGTVQPGNTANTTPWLTTDTPATSGGLSADTYITTGASNQDQHSVKASAGQLYGYAIFNTTASVKYVKVYNASAPTSGSTPVLRLMVPASGGLNVDIPKGIAFGTAIGIRATTGAADNDTNACTTNDLLINLWYK
jgi:hypothetical protein